jgi:thiol:disulfide interchange protein DsbA
MRKFSLAAMLALFLPLLAHAEFQAGKHYVVLDTPVRTRDSSKVEVVEVFWYGCGHCYTFEPMIKQWKKGIAEDVDFWQSPAMWAGNMSLHAQAFYAAKALGKLEQLHDPIFTAMNVKKNKLANADQIAALFAEYGVERQDFDKAFNSFSVKSQVKQADARQRSYKITGTPELVVNGKYRVSGRTAGGQAEMLKVVDYLIEKERAQLAAN